MAISIDDLEPQLANNRDYWLGYGGADRCDGDLVLYRSGVPDAQLNAVLRFRGGELDAAVAVASRRMAGVPWLWWAGPDSDPELAAGLLARGATEVEVLPVMAVPLDQVAAFGGPPGLVISEVTESAALGEWVRAYAPSFGIPPAGAQAMAAIEAARPDPAGSLVRFAGRIDGRIAGTAALHDRHGVAGIYVVTTAAGFRRRGIGSALSAAALRAGRERGLRVGTLQATPDGAPVYRRMGFSTVARYRLFSL